MSIYAISRHERWHTCPADPQPHLFESTQQVVHITPGRPCLTPVTIRCGDTVVTIPCGRHDPYYRQCGNCRDIVTVLSLTTELVTEDPA